jgi:replicative DNA helicase
MVQALSVVDSPNPAAHALPQNVEAEAALLGALMIDNRLAEDIQLKLRPDHFHEPLHGRIYEQILRLLDRNMIASPVTLRPLFEADEEMKELGGPAYLAQLTGSGAAIIGARDFADQVYDLALLRALVGVGREMVERALDTSEEVEPKGQIEAAEAALYRVAEEGGGEGNVKTFAQATRLAVQMAEKALNTGGGLSGITTGLELVNAKTEPAQAREPDHPRRPYRLGARRLAAPTWPSTPRGVTAVHGTESRPENSAGGSGRLFSLEMSARQLSTRILVRAVREFSPKALRMGKISQPGFRNLARAAAGSRRCRSISDDTPGLPSPLAAPGAADEDGSAASEFVRGRLSAIAPGHGPQRQPQRVQEIFGDFARPQDPCQGARRAGAGALAAQPRRRAARDKRPQLSDLRESGSIEQDADIVLFIYREEYYVAAHDRATGRGDDSKIFESYEQWQRDMERVYQLAELIVAKQRHGATGQVKLKFRGQDHPVLATMPKRILPERARSPTAQGDEL